MKNDLGKNINDIEVFVKAAFPQHWPREIVFITNGIELRLRKDHYFIPVRQEVDFDTLMNLDKFLSEKYNLYIRNIYVKENPFSICVVIMRPAEIIQKENLEKEDLKKKEKITVIEVK